MPHDNDMKEDVCVCLRVWAFELGRGCGATPEKENPVASDSFPSSKRATAIFKISVDVLDGISECS